MKNKYTTHADEPFPPSSLINLSSPLSVLETLFFYEIYPMHIYVYIYVHKHKVYTYIYTYILWFIGTVAFLCSHIRFRFYIIIARVNVQIIK